MKPETPPALDTSFRAALARMRAAGRLRTLGREADPDLEIASIMKKLDGAHALVFPSVRGHGVPVIGNLLGSQANCEAAFGAGFREIRGFVARGLGNPIPPERVSQAPCQARVHRQGFDIGKMFPVLRHTEADSGRFITAGIAIVQDPETGVYNASYHRLQLLGPNRTAVKLDYGRHLRAAFERAQRMKKDLPVAFVLGTDLAVQYTAATMGAQMPESADELAVAGGVRGSPLPVARCVTQDLWIPAESEIVLEGVMRHAGTVREGPFGEFIGYLSPQGDAPVFEISAVTHREHPVYPAINGYGRETVMLRKYVMEASLLKALQASVPIIHDAEMTAGGLHRFIAVLSVKKTSPSTTACSATPSSPPSRRSRTSTSSLPWTTTSTSATRWTWSTRSRRAWRLRATSSSFRRPAGTSTCAPATAGSWQRWASTPPCPSSSARALRASGSRMSPQRKRTSTAMFPPFHG